MAQGKRTLKKYQIATSGDLSADFTSLPTFVQTFDRFNLLVNVAGVPTGSLEVQASIDYQPSNDGGTPAFNAGTWYTIPFTLNAIAGAPQDYMFDFTEHGLVAVRVHYTFTGGTGTINAFIAAKES